MKFKITRAKIRSIAGRVWYITKTAWRLIFWTLFGPPFKVIRSVKRENPFLPDRSPIERNWLYGQKVFRFVWLIAFVGFCLHPQIFFGAILLFVFFVEQGMKELRRVDDYDKEILFKYFMETAKMAGKEQLNDGKT